MFTGLLLCIREDLSSLVFHQFVGQLSYVSLMHVFEISDAGCYCNQGQWIWGLFSQERVTHGNLRKRVWKTIAYSGREYSYRFNRQWYPCQSKKWHRENSSLLHTSNRENRSFEERDTRFFGNKFSWILIITLRCIFAIISVLLLVVSSAVLLLVPTRELALQTSQVCKELAKHLSIQIMVTTGGTSLKDDIMRLYQPVHLLVGTPGRVLDLANKGVCNLRECSMLVMDEVSWMHLTT